MNDEASMQGLTPKSGQSSLPNLDAVPWKPGESPLPQQSFTAYILLGVGFSLVNLRIF